MIDYEYEPHTGDGWEEEFFPESYEFISVVKVFSLSFFGRENLVDNFDKQELINSVRQAEYEL